MTTSSDIDNQIRLFNAILRLDEKLDRMESRIDRRFDRLESRVARIEDAIYEIRDYIQRSASRGMGFNPTPQTSSSEQIEDDEAT